MMVHNADPAWYVLDLGAPDAVEAVTSDLDCRHDRELRTNASVRGFSLPAVVV
jgi:hypothetical protein